MQSLIQKIRQKKELRDISSQFVREELGRYFQNNPRAKEFLNRPRSEGCRKVIKEVRASLRRVSGLFEGATLETHSSTKERFSFYPQLYSELWRLTGRPEIILDLGCGLNPLSFPFMKLKDITYHAYDINGKDISIVNKFFRENKIKGEAQVKDITAVKIFPVADIAFLFKAADVIDRGKGHKRTEELAGRIPAKYLVISFPTLTMSGRAMNFPRRKWIELMCRRLNYPFRVLQFPSEIFYVIEK